MRFLKALTAGGLLVVGLALASMTVFAASATSSTTLSFTVPATISMTGLAASYSGTAPPGATTTIGTGPITIATNDPLGWNLTLSGTQFNGPGSLAASIDTASASPCPVVGTPGAGNQCTTFAMSSTAQTLVVTNGTANNVTFSVNHAITVPAAQPPGVYTNTTTYIATGN
jgi:hypothetical protein